jgi:hypothetical protein
MAASRARTTLRSARSMGASRSRPHLPRDGNHHGEDGDLYEQRRDSDVADETPLARADSARTSERLGHTGIMSAQRRT